MKIALLTLPLNFNYGGIIQNYALQTVLKRMGHEVNTVNIIKPKAKMDFFKSPWHIIKRIIKKILGRKDGIIFLERKINNDNLIIEQHVRRFINFNINLTKPLYNKEEIKALNDTGYEAFIVGSDQVWRIPYVYPDIQTYFLDFITNKNTKKIAFSASFGTDEIEFNDNQIKECGILLQDFEFVSVREDDGLDLINNKYNWKCKNEAIHTIDPTMLLTKEDYNNLSSNYENQLDGELFYYVLDMTEDKKKVIEQISKDLGYKPFTVNSNNKDIYSNPNDRIVPPLELWLQAFNKAKYVFTDSFHGSVFSIIYNKDFIVYGNEERGMSRFNSLLKDFPPLQNRLIYRAEDYKADLTNLHIEWEDINKMLDKKKNFAISKLSEQLNKVNLIS